MGRTIISAHLHGDLNRRCGNGFSHLFQSILSRLDAYLDAAFEGGHEEEVDQADLGHDLPKVQKSQRPLAITRERECRGLPRLSPRADQGSLRVS